MAPVLVMPAVIFTRVILIVIGFMATIVMVIELFILGIVVGYSFRYEFPYASFSI